MQGLETLAIWMLCPAYNVRQQPPWNLRRISPARARGDRELRNTLGFAYKLARSVARLLLWALVIFATWTYWMWVR